MFSTGQVINSQQLLLLILVQSECPKSATCSGIVLGVWEWFVVKANKALAREKAYIYCVCIDYYICSYGPG